MAFDAQRINTKFGLIALDDCRDVALGGSVDAGDGVSFHDRCPIALPDHWKEWLGTLATDHVHDANLIIAVQVTSATPQILDAETNAVDERLRALFYCLLLDGIVDYRAGVAFLGGIGPDGSLSVRQHYQIPTAYRHAAGSRPRVTPAAVTRAKRRAEVLMGLHVHDDYRRLRAGFRACIAGIEEITPQERIHQYVRAIDGLMHIPVGNGRETFAARGQTFVSGNNVADALRDLYRLRNAQEHLNSLRAAITAADDDEFQRVASLRAYQAQQGALFCYGRLFDNAPLLQQFETDASTDVFWALSDVARSGLWGTAFDMDAAEIEHNRVYALLHH